MPDSSYSLKWERRRWLERHLESFSVPNPHLLGLYRISGTSRLFYEATGQRRKGAHRQLIKAMRPDDPQAHD